MKFFTAIPDRYHSLIREKAISRAQTRIVLAGRDPQDFTEEDLEVVVREEEDKIKGEFKEKGLFALLALLGLSFFG